MIHGTVTTDHEPVVHLKVRGPGGIEKELDVVVDTGFTGALVLPNGVIDQLGLNWRSGGTAVLADGTTQQTDYYEVDLAWVSTWRTVLAMTVGPESLLGMRLLVGCRLTIDGSPGGGVEIAPAP